MKIERGDYRNGITRDSVFFKVALPGGGGGGLGLIIPGGGGGGGPGGPAPGGGGGGGAPGPFAMREGGDLEIGADSFTMECINDLKLPVNTMKSNEKKAPVIRDESKSKASTYLFVSRLLFSFVSLLFFQNLTLP